MDKKEIQRRIDVMQAFLDGKEIELTPQLSYGHWREAPRPKFDWLEYDYRVKEYTPITFSSQLRFQGLKFVTKDSWDEVVFWTKTPVVNGVGGWSGDSSDCLKIGKAHHSIFGIDPGTIPWNESLIEL